MTQAPLFAPAPSKRAQILVAFKTRAWRLQEKLTITLATGLVLELDPQDGAWLYATFRRPGGLIGWEEECDLVVDLAIPRDATRFPTGSQLPQAGEDGEEVWEVVYAWQEVR